MAQPVSPGGSRRGNMLGAIRRREILAHPIVTVRCFGVSVFLRALFSPRRQTFLSLLTETGVCRPRRMGSPAVLSRCARLELRVAAIYAALADRFESNGPVRDFFSRLSEQEAGHFELLELCAELAGAGGWCDEAFDPSREAVPRVEALLDETEASCDEICDVCDALRLVLLLEGSELDRIFAGVVAATDSAFVRSIRAFHEADELHIAFICERIPALEPTLADACRRLLAAHCG